VVIGSFSLDAESRPSLAAAPEGSSHGVGLSAGMATSYGRLGMLSPTSIRDRAEALHRVCSSHGNSGHMKHWPGDG
jgi:hypothetical protein